MLAPLYGTGFVTAFAAHAVAANLGGYGIAHHASLWQLGLLLGVYDLAEIVLKPAFGTLSDRVGPRPVLLGGLLVFALASAAFAVAGQAQSLGAARLAQGAAAAAFSPAAGATLAALVSLLAATTAALQRWAGRAHDRAALPRNTGPGGILLAAAGFIIAVIIPGVPGIAIAAILIGARIAISTPIGFANLAAAAPQGRMGQTMGAGEVGRELGDAGGPILVGAFSPAGLATGLVALAGAITLGALTTWRRAEPHRADTLTSALSTDT